MRNARHPRMSARNEEAVWWGSIFASVLVALYLTLELASLLEGEGWIGGFPVFTFIGDLLFGRTKWTSTHSFALVLVIAAFLVAGLLLFLLLPARGARKETLHKAKRMSRGLGLTKKAIEGETVAKSLTTGDQHSILLCQTLAEQDERYIGLEDTVVVIQGPRIGKTSQITIPVVVEHQGNVIFTGNKRDIADAVRGARPGPSWIFDPEQICSRDKPTWRVDPLAYVVDEVRAHKLAKIWMDASGPTANAQRDAYFDSAGPHLLAGLILACKLESLPISQVYKWLVAPRNKTAIGILKKHDYLLPAMALEGVYFAPEDQKGGVFGTAAEMVSFLNNSRVRSWVEKDGPADLRPVFSPETFVRGDYATLGLLSKEGIGTTGPLTAALTIAVLDAAEEYAQEHPGGRLPVPLLAMLDEVANICRIKDLPSLYSHYGSRGIIVFAVVQNWSQMVLAWGPDGAMALWNAATIRVVGGGLADTDFLEKVSKLVGEHEYQEHSSSYTTGDRRSRTYNTSPKKEPILTVDDLASLPKGQFVVHYSGNRAFLGQGISWWDRPEIADQIQASIDKYEPVTSR